MFTILDTVNRFLGYLNIHIKVKNRIYIILGVVTNLYIGYLVVEFFQTKAYLRGSIYLLILLVLGYFWLLNYFYYFKDKTVKWDISPWIEQKLMLHLPEEQGGKTNELIAGKVGDHVIIYDHPTREYAANELLTAEVILTPEGQEALKKLVTYFSENKLITPYGNKKDKKITQKTSALVEPLRIPSSEIREEDGQLLLYVGLNAMERKKVGFVQKIANIEGKKISENYSLQPATVSILGGEFKLPGRTSLIKEFEPYHVKLEVAMQAKNT